MDLLFLWRKLYKNKWLIIFMSVIAAATAYWFAKQQPLSYKSVATIATGVINNPNEVSSSAAYIQPYRVDNTLSAIIEMMRSRISVTHLSKALYLNDYSQSSNTFRHMPPEVAKFTQNELEQIADYLQRVDYNSSVALPDRMGEMYNEVLKMLRYDYNTLVKNLRIERVGSTDYIKIEFTSENPRLSAFVVNNLAAFFTERYNASTNAQTKNSLQYYAKLAEDKKRELNGKIESLRRYKLNNKVVDYGAQAKTNIDQLRELEVKREEINQKIPSYERAIQNYERYLNQNDNTLSQLREYNREIGDMKERINTLTQQYVGGGSKDKELKNQIESLKIQLQVLIQNSALGQQTVQNSTSKKDIEEKKIAAETELEIAKASLVSIDREIQRIKSSAVTLVSGEATIANLEQDINSNSTEYMEILNKLNSTEFAVQSLTNPLSIVEKGLVPDKAEPTKTKLITALAAASGFLLATAFVFLLGFTDNTYTTPNRFISFTGLPLLETVNKVATTALPLIGNGKREKTQFKESVRKLRYAIEESGAKKLLLTSLHKGEGKTYLALALASALMQNNKKVLVIDTNFKHNAISALLDKNGSLAASANQQHCLNHLQNLINLYQLNSTFTRVGTLFLNKNEQNNHLGVTVMGCIPVPDNSPAEVFGKTDFNAFLEHVAKDYDYIILEGAPLKHFADTKELMRFADKVIAVFAANSPHQESDSNALQYLHALNQENGKLLGSVLNKVHLTDLN
ncbi:MAG TPA: AAA family ATPase [Chitinophagales bacterium]|nr:AAA family ATPase [Chitinophagales bacterium]HRK26618.1 AAA family ATPase [Chitinophagales bacterium]